MKFCSLLWQEHQRKLALSVHEKMTFAGRTRAGQTKLRKELKEESNIPVTHNHGQLQITPAWRVSMKGEPHHTTSRLHQTWVLPCRINQISEIFPAQIFDFV